MNDRRHRLGVSDPFTLLDVEGVSLAYDDSGVRREHASTIPVVCLHAVGHGGGDFDFFRERVRAQHRVIRLDWPGQGRSGSDHQPASAARYAALLELFLDAIGVEEVILLGNSIGGAAALRFAASQPKRVRALVLANPGGLATVDFASRLICRGMARVFRSGARGAGWFESAFRVYYGTVLQRPEASARRVEIVSAGYEIAPVLAEAWQSFAQADADLSGLAAEIECPVWFPWAKDDRIVSYRRSRDVIEAFPNASVQLFRGGHSAFLEDREAFVEGFLAFADQKRFPSPSHSSRNPAR
jgi:4,5:9,10-diseco-3-hydroxy-5,9,17-trioxoandrosta-1(10),2-diene-4-oate hydrolase